MFEKEWLWAYKNQSSQGSIVGIRQVVHERVQGVAACNVIIKTWRSWVRIGLEVGVLGGTPYGLHE